MARLLIPLLIAVSIAACDHPQRVPSTEITPDPPPSEPPEPPPPPPAPLEDPEPAPVTFSVPEEADALPEVPTVELGRRVTTRAGGYRVPQVTDPVTRQRLAFVHELLGSEIAYTEPPEDPTGSSDEDTSLLGGCLPILATDRVVSTVCYHPDMSRIHGWRNIFGGSMHFVLVDGQVIPFELSDALTEGSTLGELITEELCVADLMAQGRRRMPAIRLCRPAVNAPEQWVLGATGFEHAYDLHRPDPPTFSVSYAALREHLRPDGPIAWIFEAVRSPLWVSEEDASGLAVTPVLPWAELGALAATLTDEQLTRVKAQTFPLDVGGRLVLDSTDALEEARALAERLGGTVHRARWPEGSLRTMRRMRTSSVADLHTARRQARPYGASWRTLPEGTHLLGVAEAEGTPSPATLASGADRMFGFVLSDHLVPDTGCRPDPSAFIASWPEAQREAARERLHVVSTTVRTDPAGPPRPVALFAALVERESRISMVAMDASCVLGDALLEQTIPGRFFDLRLGTSERDGAGESFLLIGMYEGEQRRTWHAFRVSNGRRIFTESLVGDDLIGNEASFSHYVRLGSLRDQEDPSSWAPLSFGYRPFRWTGRLVEMTDR